MTRTLPKQSEWQKLEFSSPLNLEESPVDREARTIKQVTVAQAGKMKDGRGYFDEASIDAIVALGNASSKGPKSRFSHPNMSDDGVGKHLGRFKPFEKIIRDGVPTAVANQKLSEAASKSPHGDLADYVMTLAEEDPEAFATSIVIKSDYFNEEGEKITQAEMQQAWHDNPGTTYWLPTALHAVDVVDTGNATTSFLSEDGLPDVVVRQATHLMQTQFEGQPRDVVEARALAFLNRFLDHEYGAVEMADEQAVVQEPETQAEQTPTPEAPSTPVVENPETDLAPSAEEQVLAERNRTTAILELCQMVGKSDQAQSFISDPRVTPEALRTRFATEAASNHAVADLTAGNQVEVKSTKSPEDLDREEYAKNRRFYETHGVSEEDYLATAKTERNGGYVNTVPPARLADLID